MRIMRRCRLVCVALGALLVLVTAAKAQAELAALPTECETFLRQQTAAGADLMRLLALESVQPVMTDAAWVECRTLALLHIDANYQREKERKYRELREWVESLKNG